MFKEIQNINDIQSAVADIKDIRFNRQPNSEVCELGEIKTY